MKIVLINGSPKNKSSSSEAALKDLQTCISKDTEIINYNFKKPFLIKEEVYQNRWAISIMKNWCAKTGFRWGQGVGIGCGGALASMSGLALGTGPKSSMGAAFKSLAANIHNKSQANDVYLSLNFPRFLYKLMAEFGWRQSIKKNGLKVRDLSRRL